LFKTGNLYFASPISFLVYLKSSPKLLELLKLDISKARYHLGWKPRLNIDQTISMLVDWYKKDNISYDFNVRQINDYIKMGENKYE
jgi:CDP-glucose 4,6-dehydratase